MRLPALALLLLALGGCLPKPAPVPVPADGAAPWQIPQAAYGSQRLYRVSYSGPEGEGNIRLTLRLASAERYQVTTADPLGRSLWSLDVAQDSGLWLDHRNRTYCRFEGRFDISGVPLAPFPLLSLPSLLLGRLPAEPAAPPREKGKDITYKDARERRWTATLADGQVASWTLWDGQSPAVLWVQRDSWAILSDRSQNVQMRWKEVVREPLPRPPEPLAIPSGFDEEDCVESAI
ncbi:MAG TPA: hypothetical protein VMM92_03480 [Thermoanaerobaculia bacterium]|nr:hypothetical protein [Thermoanaerobaculia bacterium]